MPDDNTGKVNSETKTSDEELSNAYRETFGEEAGDTPELLEAAKKKLADVKELQKKGAYTAAEGSRLGREIKSLKTTINEMQQTLKTLVESRTISSISSSEEFPSYISTVDDLKKWRKSEKKELKNAEVKYGQTYIGLVKEMMKEDEDIDESSQKEVWDLLSGQGSAFNIRRGDIDDPDTWNPVIDAEINYAKAKGHLFKTKNNETEAECEGRKRSFNKSKHLVSF